MWTILHDLLRHNRGFATGTAMIGFVLAFAALSFVSPYSPIDQFVVPPDMPPGWPHVLGTTSRGQDVFWLLTFAIRNTLAFGLLVALISRLLSLTIGLVAGYAGGWVDRVLMSVNDTFIVIPLFPILVLFYFVLRDHMSWLSLAAVMACLGWAYDARLIRSVALSLRTREFTETSIFSGMGIGRILVEEHLPYVMPIMQQARALAQTLAGTPTPVVYPAMPVAVKTPWMPLVVLPPAVTDVEWQFEALDDGLIARAENAQGLQGFVLLGATAGKQRLALTKQVPDLMPLA